MTAQLEFPLNINQSWARIYQDLVLRGEIRRIGLAAFGVYTVIKSFADRDTGIARITHARLGELIGISDRTAIRMISTLESSKLVEVLRRHRRVNEYRVIERLLVRKATTGEIAGELFWPTASAAQSAIDTSIRIFKDTGVPPARVRYSRTLRAVELEETYEVTHKHDLVDNCPQGDNAVVFDLCPCQPNELLGAAHVTPSSEYLFQEGITLKKDSAKKKGNERQV